MYISIKLPPAFGSFNQLRKENYPFNTLFTSYLAAVSQLGLNLKMDVGELVGYIEDRIFEGQRLPDVPEGKEPVNIRYKMNIPEDADENHPGRIVQRYIEGSTLTNRMAVMYIARMTLRISAAYGTSLLRLTRLITDLGDEEPAKKPKAEPKKQEPVRTKPKAEDIESEPEPMPKVRIRASEPKSEPSQSSSPASQSTSAQAARAAVSELAGLAAQVAESEPKEETDIVETNPALASFL